MCGDPVRPRLEVLPSDTPVEGDAVDALVATDAEAADEVATGRDLRDLEIDAGRASEDERQDDSTCALGPASGE